MKPTIPPFAVAAALAAASPAAAAALAFPTVPSLGVSGNLVVDQLLMPPTGRNQTAQQPCNTIMGGTLNTGWCINTTGTATPSLAAYFDSEVSVGGQTLGMMSGQDTLGSGFSTDQLSYLRVDPGAAAGGNALRMTVSSSSQIPGLWLGAWIGGTQMGAGSAGPSGPNASALVILGANANGVPAWNTGIRLEHVWNTGFSDSSSGGVAAIAITGNHNTGILVDPAATFNGPIVLMPSDPVANSLEGFVWHAQTSGSGAPNVALAPNNLAGAPCGLCVSAQPTGTAPAAVRSVRFRSGGGLSTETALGNGRDANGDVSEWQQVYAVSGTGTLAFAPSSGAADVLASIAGRRSGTAVRMEVSCTMSGAASVVDTVAVYSATGALVSSGSTPVLGTPPAIASASQIRAGLPVATVTANAPAVCAADAHFGELP